MKDLTLNNLVVLFNSWQTAIVRFEKKCKDILNSFINRFLCKFSFIKKGNHKKKLNYHCLFYVSRETLRNQKSGSS